MSLVRRALWLFALVGPAVVFACGDDEPAPRVVPPSAVDAGPADASAPVAVDAAPPPATCGDRTGLASGAPWPAVGGCATRAGVAATAGARSSAVTTTLAAGATSPVIDATNVVWFGTASGEILAVRDGARLGTLATGGPVRGGGALDAQGRFVVGGGDGTLYGLDRAAPDADAGDGGDAEAGVPELKVLFARPLGPMGGSPILGADGTIFVTTLDGKLHALAPGAASERWAATTNDTAGSSPALGPDGTAYVGSSDGQLYAIAPDGSTRWTRALGAAVASPAVGADVYVGTADGKLHAVAFDGAVRWSYAAGGAITTAPAVAGDTVFAGAADRKLHAVATADGAARFAYVTQGAVATPVVASDGTVFVGATDARLYAITKTGSLFFAAGVRGKVAGAPAIAGAVVHVATENGLAAVGP